MRLNTASDIFRSSLHHNATTPCSAFGTDVDDPVGRLDHIEIMLDHNHGITRFHKALQDLNQLLDVGKVQACCGFVQQIQSSPGRTFPQFSREFHALSFPAGKSWRRLTELHVLQTNIAQRLKQLFDLWKAFEELHPIPNFQVEHISDAVIAKLDLQRFVIESSSLTHRAGDPDIRQKIHFQLGRTMAFTRFAATVFNIETETSLFVASHF